MSQEALSESFFVQTFLEHQREIRRYVASLLPNRADADDVFQRVSLVLWEKIDKFDQERSFSAWARGIAFYEVKNFVRIQTRSRLYFDDELLAILALESEDRADVRDRRIVAMQDCLQELASQDQKLVETCYGKESTIKEIAMRLGRTSTSIYKRLDRIRAKLQACIRLRTACGGSNV